MCGIAGIFNFSSKRKIKEEALKKMIFSLRRRGPDEEGIFMDERILMGCRRLSIIDLKTGHQPIANEDKTLWLVFNGEIYNFCSLREELVKKGHRFATKTDSECILHLYEEKGENCLGKLDGMFAFALWDAKKEKLFLARDRLGKKPLYWAFSQDCFLFASEVKGILTFPGFKKEIDENSLANYFFYGFVPSPASIFKKIYKLSPGYFLTVEKNGLMKEKKYWEIDYSFQGEEDDEEVIKKAEKYLQAAVEKRLMADVPLGIFLSGGIDSSLVVATMAKIINPKDIQAFTIGYKEKKFDETFWAEKVAKFLGINHRLKLFSLNEVFDLLPKIGDFLDEPVADPSILPTFLVSLFARENGMKVVLSGDGGDEAFGGYPKYLAHWFLRWSRLEKIPLSWLAPIFSGKWSDFFRYANIPLPLRNQLWISHFPPERILKLIGGKPSFAPIERIQKDFNGKNVLDLAFFLDQKLVLPDLYLAKVDRASMAASLEVRCPFLDQKLVEFSAKIPFTQKLKGFKNKYLLKKMALRFFPAKIVARPKMGFGIPLSSWIKDPRSKIFKLISLEKLKKSGLLNAQIVDDIIKYGRSEQIWSLLIFELWREKWLKN